MVFKPNYNQQRSERNRLKQAKKDEKLREKQDALNRRKVGSGSSDAESPAPESPPPAAEPTT